MLQTDNRLTHLAPSSEFLFQYKAWQSIWLPASNHSPLTFSLSFAVCSAVCLLEQKPKVSLLFACSFHVSLVSFFCSLLTHNMVQWVIHWRFLICHLKCTHFSHLTHRPAVYQPLWKGALTKFISLSLNVKASFFHKHINLRAHIIVVVYTRNLFPRSEGVLMNACVRTCPCCEWERLEWTDISHFQSHS